jgi:hypothetical protein
MRWGWMLVCVGCAAGKLPDPPLGGVDSDTVGVDTDPPLDPETDTPTESDPAPPVDTDAIETGGVDTDVGLPGDADGDGWAVLLDCDDGDRHVYPGAVEICDGRDNDCDPSNLEDHPGFVPRVGRMIDLTPLLGPGLVWTTPEAGTVWLCPGTQAGTIDVAAASVTVRSSPLGQALLDGGADRAVNVGPGIADALVTDVALRGAADDGGALRVEDDGAATLQQVQIEGARGVRGGAAAVEVGARLTVEDSAIEGCSATLGGAVVVARDATLLLTDVRLEGNTASEFGGAVYLEEGGASLDGVRVQLLANAAGVYGGGVAADTFTVLLRCADCMWTGNEAGGGGGAIWGEIVEELQLTNNELRDNIAISGHGGGINVTGNLRAALVGLVVSGNTAGGDGGGIYLWDMLNPNITDLVVEDNEAGGLGGGLFGWNLTGVLSNLRFGTNHASEGGGAITLLESSLDLVRGEVDANDAPTGGGALIIGGSFSSEDVAWFDNFADDGGALAVQGGGAAAVIGGDHGGNSAGRGGAWFVEEGEGHLLGGVWHGSRASAEGGVAWVGASGTWLAQDTELRANEAVDGAVVWSEGAAGFERSLVVENRAAGLGGIAMVEGGLFRVVASGLGTPGLDDNTVPEIITGSASWSFVGTVDVSCDAAACR